MRVQSFREIKGLIKRRLHKLQQRREDEKESFSSGCRREREREGEISFAPRDEKPAPDEIRLSARGRARPEEKCRVADLGRPLINWPRAHFPQKTVAAGRKKIHWGRAQIIN
jgi:hypothetical protein